MAKKMSISFRKGKGSVRHNNRDFVAENVDKSRIEDNIIYKQESLETAYEKCFGKAVDEYDEKQKRKDRKIGGFKGYMEQVKHSKNGEKLFYENVVQIGNMDDAKVGTSGGKIAKNILDKYMKEFEKNNPNLYVFNAVLHLDEATPHLHIDYIPLGHNYKQGLPVRNALDRALKEQGVAGKNNKFENSTIAWENAEKKRIEGLMKEHGIEKKPETGLHRKNMSVEEYKLATEKIKREVEKLPKQIETAPTLLDPKRVTVAKKDLEKLEQRAKLSITAERSIENVTSQMRRQQARLKEKEEKLDRTYDVVAEELAKATQIRSEAVRLYQEQEKLNNDYDELIEKYNGLAEAYNEKIKTVETLCRENDNLKAEISDLRQSIAKKVEEAVKTVESGLKMKIEALQKKMDSIAKGHFNLMCCIRVCVNMLKKESPVRDILESGLAMSRDYMESDGYEQFKEPKEELHQHTRDYIETPLKYKNGGIYTENGDKFVESCPNRSTAEKRFSVIKPKTQDREQ